MRNERWKQIDAILDSVLSISAESRAEYLDEVCSGDPSLFAEIDSLLKHEARASAFMEDSAMQVLGRHLASAEPSLARPSLLDRVIGTYKIERLLGSGGMADVYLAHDSKLDRRVALKVLQSEFVRDADRVRRFEREARAISALNHPNIVTIFDVDRWEGCHFIATEFVDGKTLRELIGNLSLERTLTIVSQVADALGAAHGSGLIHRDIKPENIMVRSDGYVKVLDFGLVKLTEPTAERDLSDTGAGMLLGTLAYMSPEQINGEAVDHRTDLWSLGVVLYEMLAGRNPFKSEKRHATLRNIIESEPAPVSEIDPSLPIELDSILQKALVKSTDRGYQTAVDFGGDLKQCLRNVNSGAFASESFDVRRRRRRVWWLIPAVVTVFAIAAVAAVYFGRTASTESANNGSQWSSAVASRLTDFPGEENYPTLSPDGKFIAYSREVDGDTDIYWQRVAGGSPLNLTANSDVADSQPSFSPDGERIAFRSERDGGGIFVMGSTGESVRRISNFGFNPAWSPNGQEIAFSTIGFRNPNSRGNSRSELWIADVETGAMRRIETVDAMGPAFSPNGERIAIWSVDEKFQRDIWTVSARTGEVVQVTNDDAMDWNPVWSPDAKFIYFVSNRNGGNSVWRIGIDETTGRPSGEPEAMLSPVTQSWMFALSRDGQSIAYVSRQRIENLRSISFDAASLKTGDPVELTSGSRIIRAPSVSPDGKLLVFYESDDGLDNIAISNTDGSEQRFLTSDDARDRMPRFSPDGRSIVYYTNAGNNYEIWSVNVDGGDRRSLISHEGRALCYPFFSPDGGRIAYGFIGGPTFIIDANIPSTEQVPFELPPVADGVAFIGWSWSPDGKRIVGTVRAKPGDLSVYVYSFESNTYEKLTDTGADPLWLADSRHVMVIRDGKLLVIDGLTHREKEILSIKPLDISTATISPDNTRIYFTPLSIESDIQLLSRK